MTTPSPYPRVAVDIVVLTIEDNTLNILLIERGIEPFLGMWALPGGFVHLDESVAHAARRELIEETGVRDVYLEQLYTFGEVHRDPRHRVVTVAWFALINGHTQTIQGGTDAAQARWFPLHDHPPLAFDHQDIVDLAVQRLRAKLEYAPVAFQLLPKEFTLSELQHVYETILDRSLDKRNFRRRILSLGFLEDTGHMRRTGAHRPAKLYSFSPDRFEDRTQGHTVFQFGS